MTMRLFALAAGLSLAAATPGFALTVQSAPPRPDVSQRLTPTDSRAAASVRLQDTFAGAGRPTMGSTFTGAPPTSYGTTTFGFGNVRTTVTSDPYYDRSWSNDRRDTPAPLSLSPYLPRR
ncbi:hypothetical protein [Phenylobacterium sp.]|uniref:hypothetical protein n=1 Tax=Phenylobacterium sp. TaxID=1871053 RepID=UPI0025D97727|nr:hypothetical protein [Phenylobacterium sp.]MBX3484827.1 hypothetical protein [Phenylobacterium sp.]MCW5759380.1 hypothetical protein [Phenylobacterium sp.]